MINYKNIWYWIVQNKHVLGILFIAACLRFPGFLHGLPTYPNADESVMVSLALKIFKGQWNPHFFYYPSLYFYFNTFLFTCTHIIYHSLHFLGIVKQASTPYWLFIAVGRGANIIISLFAVWLVYKIGKISFSKLVGMYAMLFMGIMPMHNFYSVRVVPNALLVTMSLSGIYFSCKYLKEKCHTDLYIAAVFSGLAIGTKYLFFAPVSFLIAKYFVDEKDLRKFFNKQLAYSIGIVIIAFCITTPALFFSFREFLNNIFFNYTHYKTSHPGYESDNTLLFYIHFLFIDGITPLIFVLSIIGLVYLTVNRREQVFVFILVPLIWFFFCSLYKVNFVHNIAIISVVFAVGAGAFLAQIKIKWVQWIILIFMSIIPLWKDIMHIHYVRRPDLRYVASEWINNNLPSGSSIAREEYTPYYDDKKFKSTYIGICGLAYLKPDSIINAGLDFIVTTGHDRFTKNPEKYSQEIKNYNEHLQRFDIIKDFKAESHYHGGDIKILKVK